VDRETGVILRTEQYRLDGSLAALTVFTGFESQSSLPSELFRLKVPQGVRLTNELSPSAPAKDLAAACGFAVRLPDFLPPGFIYDGAAVSRPDKQTVVHLRFTDGLGVISLFEQEARPFTRYRLAGGKTVALKHGRGSLHDECGGHVLNWTAGGVNFTLVGEVPAAALVQMANSVPPGPRPSPLGYVRSAFEWLFKR
jgi:negative regulator of sigma E activity